MREACHVSACVDNVRSMSCSACVDSVRSRLRMLKKDCDDITELFKTSGFGLDYSGRVSVNPIT